jgi:hypothetical protein
MSSPVDLPLPRDSRVVVYAAPDDPADLGEVLTRVLGLHPTDALLHARYAPGLFPDLLTAETARRLAESISAMGVLAAVIPDTEVPDLDEGEIVHHLRCAAHGLEVLELHGRTEHVIPWTSVELISVGQVPLETTRHFASSDMNTVRSGRRTSPSTVETSLSPGPEAWIICANPSRALRIDHKRMNYEYLGERKSDSATANFRLFLEDLVARAGHAYRTPATRAFLQHGSVADYSFESAGELQRATVLHLLLHRQARPQA